MSNKNKATKPATIADLTQQVASTAPEAKAKPETVALRGGPAVALVTTAGAKAYRVAAKHNADWYKQVQDACATGPAEVKVLIGAGVPSHFLSYCLRKGYAVAADGMTPAM